MNRCLDTIEVPRHVSTGVTDHHIFPLRSLIGCTEENREQYLLEMKDRESQEIECPDLSPNLKLQSDCLGHRISYSNLRDMSSAKRWMSCHHWQKGSPFLLDALRSTDEILTPFQTD
ncbi:hypothetical protein FKM82_022315 [Ascaphus truei]